MNLIIKDKINSFIEEDIKNLNKKEKQKIIEDKKAEKRKPIFASLISLVFFAIILSLCFILNLNFVISLLALFLSIFSLVILLCNLTVYNSYTDTSILKTYFNKKYKSNSNMLLEQKLLNCKLEDDQYLTKNNFNISRIIKIETYKTLNSKATLDLLIDDENKKFIFKINENYFSNIYSFSDVLSVKVIDDKNIESVSKASVGGFVLSVLTDTPLYSTDVETVEYCSDLLVLVTLNNLKTDKIIIPYCFKKIKKKSSTYKKLKVNSDELVSAFEYIEKNKPKNSIDEIDEMKVKLEKEKLVAEIEKIKPPKYCICKYCGAKTDSKLQKCTNCGAIISE